MSVSAEQREKLAAEQATLVAALLGHRTAPAAFDTGQLEVTAAALARKRLRAAARAWPGLAKSLGTQFREHFAEYSQSTPLPRSGGPIADGRNFAEWLANRGQLPNAGRIQLLAVDLRFRRVRNEFVLRKWPAFKTAWLPDTRRLLIGLLWPGLSPMLLSLPLWPRRALPNSSL